MTAASTSTTSRPVTNAPPWFADEMADLERQSAPGLLGELEARQSRVRQRLHELGVDAVVTTHPSNIRFLSGFTSVAIGKAALVITRDGSHLAVAESELGRALVAPLASSVHVFAWDKAVDVATWVREGAATRGCRTILCEWDGAVLSRDRPAASRLPEGTGILSEIRFRISEWSADRIRAAGRATAAGVRAAHAEADRIDATDADMAAAAMAAMVSSSGYEFPATFVVGVDEGAGVPHSQWRRRELKPGGVAFLEFSGGFDGFCAPVMRTIVREPVDPDVELLFARVEAIIATLLAEMRPGARCSDIAKKCEAHISDLTGILFHYNFGYPVSVFDDQTTWMNGPNFHITVDNNGVLEQGMTFHLPIVLRRFGKYAVGQSQTVRVTDDGVEVLTVDVPTGLLLAGAGAVE